MPWCAGLQAKNRIIRPPVIHTVQAGRYSFSWAGQAQTCTQFWYKTDPDKQSLGGVILKTKARIKTVARNGPYLIPPTFSSSPSSKLRVCVCGVSIVTSAHIHKHTFLKCKCDHTAHIVLWFTFPSHLLGKSLYVRLLITASCSMDGNFIVG